MNSDNFTENLKNNRIDCDSCKNCFPISLEDDIYCDEYDKIVIRSESIGIYFACKLIK
jgi:hypothetical protein